MTESSKAGHSRPVLLVGTAAGLLLAVVLLSRVSTSHLPAALTPRSVVTPQKFRSDWEAEQAGSATTIRFLMDKVKRDPDDMIAETMLANRMLQKVRETGSADYIARAQAAAEQSLRSVPAIRNIGGLSALTRVEIATHNFTKARTHALQVVDYDPSTIGSYALLFDVLIEVGDYAKADAAVQKMRSMGLDTAETEIRLARMLFVQSDTEGAKQHLFRAIAFINNLAPPPRESLAWCQWQLGEMAFSEGDYRAADKNYRSALATFPHYVQALASLGRVLAGRGLLTEAIHQYEDAVRRFPDPTFVAALGDLYMLAHRTKEAEAQYALVEQIGHLSTINGARYNRQIAIFEADHDQHVQDAYRDAEREYQDRRDVYGADTLAWAALKAGNLARARQASQWALRLSTRDAKLYYHAGMIARIAGDRREAQIQLKRALHLNPCFDPLQAPIAQRTLEE